MELTHLTALYLFACWHVLLPGHGKTLLVAVSISCGTSRRLLWLAAGYSLSHGMMMGLAAISGLVLSTHLAQWANHHGLLLKNAYIPILFVAGLYFAANAWKNMREQCATPQATHMPRDVFAYRRPLLTGLLTGLIPCSDVLGLIVISPMLVKTHESLLLAGTTVWLGVTSMVMAIALVIRVLPTGKVMQRIPYWLTYAAAAFICLAVLVYKGWTIWRDYALLYH